MGRVQVTNLGKDAVALLLGDPATDAPHTAVRLKPGESTEVEVRGDPESDEQGSEVVVLCEDGPWVDEQMAADDGHDGSLQ